MKTKVYIDGQSGTTGLQIFDRISARQDLELLRIDEDKRHDLEERRKFLNAADIVFLCLPDDGAREAVSLIDNPSVRVIDASTAHRTDDSWVYGFPELSREQRDLIRNGKRIANPGCHATGFISIVAPLVKLGFLPEEYPVTCYSLTGYSGGGKRMIQDYEDNHRDGALDSPGIYGLSLKHKHIPEMMKLTGLQYAPVFIPVVDDYYKGMASTVALQNRLLRGIPSAAQICKALKDYYKDEHFVEVLDYDPNPGTVYANTNAGTNRLQIRVCGNDEQTSIIALFDNLGKGASGAAVQNMNIMLGLDETMGLE
ncbi:MAG: N-acetyl-gamma-glutamyl-phosphate reductase [Lachnospiraceae bacterium]|nr:N-acetyl-gamma-glutamyl-phosphate reductase [Lachnospiraceae bacterium]